MILSSFGESGRQVAIRRRDDKIEGDDFPVCVSSLTSCYSICFTSGSTGDPKGSLHLFDSFLIGLLSCVPPYSSMPSTLSRYCLLAWRSQSWHYLLLRKRYFGVSGPFGGGWSSLPFSFVTLWCVSSHRCIFSGLLSNRCHTPHEGIVIRIFETAEELSLSMMYEIKREGRGGKEREEGDRGEGEGERRKWHPLRLDVIKISRLRRACAIVRPSIFSAVPRLFNDLYMEYLRRLREEYHTFLSTSEEWFSVCLAEGKRKKKAFSSLFAKSLSLSLSLSLFVSVSLSLCLSVSLSLCDLFINSGFDAEFWRENEDCGGGRSPSHACCHGIHEIRLNLSHCLRCAFYRFSHRISIE